MKCPCAKLIFTEYNTTICRDCGLEQKVPFRLEIEQCSYTQTYAPLNYCYTRSQRFNNMVTMLFFPNASKHDEPILKLLCGRRFKTIRELKSAMKKTKVKNKRYCNLHFFCKMFLETYKPPSINQNVLLIYQKMLGQFFINLESSFNIHAQHFTFFNYAWLIRKLLIKFNLCEFCIYLKRLCNKKRNEEYCQRFQYLMDKTS